MVLLDAILKQYANAIIDLLLLHSRHDLVWLKRVVANKNDVGAKNVTKNCWTALALNRRIIVFITNIYYRCC